MTSRQERYFRNYELRGEPADNRKGFRRRYVYIGDLYSWEPKGETIGAVRRWFALCEVASLLIFAGSAAMGNLLNRTGYIAVPALFSVAAWVFELIAAYYFCIKKHPLREDDYEYIDRVWSLTFFLRELCLAFAAGACAVFLARKGPDATGLILTLGYGATALLAHRMGRRYKALRRDRKILMHDTQS